MYKSPQMSLLVLATMSSNRQYLPVPKKRSEVGSRGEAFSYVPHSSSFHHQERYTVICFRELCFQVSLIGTINPVKGISGNVGKRRLGGT